MPPQKTLLVARATAIIAADPGEVWTALVDPAAIKQYMFGATVESDWSEGSSIVWRGEWQGRAYEDKGTILRFDPGYFSRLAHIQPPDLSGSAARTAGCRPTRSSAWRPGELFVHRNVANVVGAHDLNCLAVISTRWTSLEVRHIIVCGHYGCGGVRAALAGDRLGLVDNWLRHVRGPRRDARAALDELPARRRALRPALRAQRRRSRCKRLRRRRSSRTPGSAARSSRCHGMDLRARATACCATWRSP